MQLDLFIACQPLFGGDAGTSAGAHPATEPAKARRGVSCHCSCSFHLSASQQADNNQALRLGPLAADAVFIRLRKPGSADAVEFPAELLVTAGPTAASSRVNLSVGSAVFPVVRHCIIKVLCSSAVHACLQPAYQQLPQLVVADPPAAPAQPLAFATLVTPTISFNMHLRTPTTEDVQYLASVMQVMLAPHMPEQQQQQQQQQQQEEDRRLSQQQEPAALQRPLAAMPAPRAPGPSATTAVDESPPGQPGQDQLQQQQQQQRLPLTQLGAEGPSSSSALHPPAAGGGGAGPAPARLTGAKRPAPAAEGSPVQAADQPAVTAAAGAAGGEASGAHGAAAHHRPPPDAAGAAAAQRRVHAGVPPQLSSAWAGQLGLEVALLEQVCRQAAAAGGGGAGGGAAPIAAGAVNEALLHHNLDALAHLHLAASSVPVWQGRA